ncbi:carbohydrate ABC transporter permease [Bifidobacterium scaligerum]|uniref:Sugar ABC transporter permease n=1 Tax=Bifidobacterium scaligerum TaxID=2052656 RepID=A0A2M9HNY3_9BIFI|nr:sugar ABC transporter permease [Bifidobacterium scaligerum]PJM78515.1 sugar ABC transporter permease [Bifidobacterium scaligerum]
MNASATSAIAKVRRRPLSPEDRATFFFLLPIMVVFAVLTLVPLLSSVYYSLTDYNGFSTDFNMVGLKNYVTIFSEPELLHSLGFTLLFAVSTTLLITVLALPLAVTLNKQFYGRSLARSLFFFLGIPAQAILGLIWRQIFSPMKSGIFNQILDLFTIPPIPWTSDDHWAQFCVIFVGVWMGVGWHATLYLAYMQAIPADLYEQSLIDGANSRQQFIHITLSQLVPAIVVSTFLIMTGNLKVYDLPFTLTAGGPRNATMTITQAILLRGTGQSQYGVGSALAVLFTIVCLLLVTIQQIVASAIQRRFE